MTDESNKPKIEVMVPMSNAPWSYFVVDCHGRSCTVKIDIDKWFRYDFNDRRCFDHNITQDEIDILNYELYMAAHGVTEDELFTVARGGWYDAVIPTKLYKAGIRVDGDSWKLDCVANYILGMIEKRME